MSKNNTLNTTELMTGKDGRLFVVDKAGKLYWVDPDDGSRHLISDRYRQGHFTGLNDCCFDTKGGFYFTEPYGSTATNPVATNGETTLTGCSIHLLIRKQHLLSAINVGVTS